MMIRTITGVKRRLIYSSQKMIFNITFIFKNIGIYCNNIVKIMNIKNSLKMINIS